MPPQTTEHSRAIAPGRKALRPSFPLRLQLSPHAQLCVSPFRPDCRSAGQVLDARGPLCLFLESLRARFWSPFRRKTRWPCVRRKHVHRRRDTATIDRRSRCYKSCAGAWTSLASAESTNAGAHSFLTACQPAGFVFRGGRHPAEPSGAGRLFAKAPAARKPKWKWPRPTGRPATHPQLATCHRAATTFLFLWWNSIFDSPPRACQCKSVKTGAGYIHKQSILTARWAAGHAFRRPFHLRPRSDRGTSATWLLPVLVGCTHAQGAMTRPAKSRHRAKRWRLSILRSWPHQKVAGIVTVAG